MLTYACPSCGKTLQSPENQATLICPHCRQAIRAPVPEKKNITLAWVFGMLGALLAIFIVVCLAAISVMGSNASGKFKAVAETVGSGPRVPK